jgi:hypothetical protein
MPVPARTAPTRAANPAALVPSQGGARPDEAAVRRAMSLQGMGASSHPMLPAPGAPVLPMGAAAPPAGNEWFAGNMMQALDKYQRSSKLGRPAEAAP